MCNQLENIFAFFIPLLSWVKFIVYPMLMITQCLWQCLPHGQKFILLNMPVMQKFSAVWYHPDIDR